MLECKKQDILGILKTFYVVLQTSNWWIFLMINIDPLLNKDHRLGCQYSVLYFPEYHEHVINLLQAKRGYGRFQLLELT